MLSYFEQYMTVKIMVELLSTLALAAKKLKEGRPSASVIADMLPQLNVIQRYL
jgi:hypothetical protein